jgi:hypothetical protein
MLSDRYLYKQDPFISVGLTSRGTWTVSAVKWDFAKEYTPRGRAFSRFKKVDLEVAGVPAAVEEAISWLYSEPVGKSSSMVRS